MPLSMKLSLYSSSVDALGIDANHKQKDNRAVKCAFPTRGW